MLTAGFISSAANPLLKDVRKALSRGTLTADGCCVVETFHLLEEALRSACLVRVVIASESARSRVEHLLCGTPAIRLNIVSDRLLDSLAGVAASQGVLALVVPPEFSIEQALGTESLVLLIDGLQDPGNLGTILRSAEAFRATGVLLLKGVVSPFNSKALRASAGSVFRVPFICGMDEVHALEALRSREIALYAAVPDSGSHGSSLSDADLTAPCAIAVGSEGRGVGPSLRGAARDLSIPTAGVESLNAAVSAAILLYEARRQRSRVK